MRSIHRPPFFLLAIPFVLMAASANAEARFASAAADLERVADLIVQRLELMRPVGLWKKHHGLPIKDVDREQQVLDATVRDAQRLGIEPNSARRFFEVQIELARDIQQRIIDSDERANPPLRDLSSDLRPALDRIGRDLLIAIYLAIPEFETEGFRANRSRWSAAFAAAGADRDSARLLMNALASLRRDDMPVRARVQASGVLRIGMTGDYAPFSLERDGQLTGIDVSNAIELARTLGVTPRFIRTSWPTLMQDYAAGRFDVAMSGISITPERASVAYFSVPYQQGGKTPIVSCGTQMSFDTLTEIDMPDVRVVVNPGGTNERFVRERLTQAQVRIHADNRTIFDEIANDRADVMITDDIEVELQIRKDKRLCRATAQTFTRSDKAALLPRDTEWRAALDAWFTQAIESGKLARRFEAALSTPH